MQHDTEIRAAQEMGIRFHLARGSHDLGQKDGATPLDHTTERIDDILADTERLIKTYHEFGPGGMVRIENAPSSLFAVSERLWRESIALARQYGIGNHTHMAEAPDEERWVRERYGMRSVEVAEKFGWVGPDVWYAHATMLDERETEIVRRTGTGICNCPNSNMYTAAHVCRVAPMLRQGGFTIGLGVDGSAANNSSHLLREARNALLMQRAFFGADALSPTQALEIAILGGARCPPPRRHRRSRPREGGRHYRRGYSPARIRGRRARPGRRARIVRCRPGRPVDRERGGAGRAWRTAWGGL